MGLPGGRNGGGGLALLLPFVVAAVARAKELRYNLLKIATCAASLATGLAQSEAAWVSDEMTSLLGSVGEAYLAAFDDEAAAEAE